MGAAEPEPTAEPTKPWDWHQVYLALHQAGLSKVKATRMADWLTRRGVERRG